jgi:hypothetical protein
MTTIKSTIYQQHPNIAIIEKCLEDATNGVSQLPEFSLNLWGMSGKVYRRFINNYARSIENPKYLEFGSYTGSTLCAVVGGVPNIKALAVDNFSLGGSSQQQCLDNVNNVKTLDSDITVLNQDFNSFDFTAHGKFNIYMYDAEHDEHDQANAIIRVGPALEEISLIVVDDWNDHGYVTPVKVGTYRGFESCNLEVLYKWEVETGVNGPIGSDWHNGYGIFLVKNPQV